VPALLGGTAAVSRPFPEWPQHAELELELLRETVESGTWWRMTGSQVRRFEKDFAKLHDARHALAVTNGTHAIELALRALGIGPGDEVIVPSLTFVATAMPVFSIGAMPVPVDVSAATWCLDPEAALAAVTPRTRAVMPVHFAGQTADMIALERLCSDHGLAIVEDAAHAHGGRWAGRAVGSFGSMAAFSFQNFKLLTAGEGGMLLVNDDALYERAMLVSNCGRPMGDTRYEHVTLGSNFRMSEFQGAVLNAQLTRLEEQGARREDNAAYLDEQLGRFAGIRPQTRDPLTDRHAHYMYVFTIDSQEFAGMHRDTLVAALAAEGVPAFRMYPRIQDTAHFAPSLAAVGGSQSPLPRCPVSRELAETGVWIHHRALLADRSATGQVVAAFDKIRRYAPRLADAAADGEL
jgi:3-amino-5-hydroxybenzoate synthase